jgi:hypothetical protein
VSADPTDQEPCCGEPRRDCGRHLQGHVLVVHPAYAGGETQYEDVKLKRDRALHLGSCVVTRYLIAPGHELSASGVEAAHASANTHVGIADVTWSVS